MTSLFNKMFESTENEKIVNWLSVYHLENEKKLYKFSRPIDNQIDEIIENLDKEKITRFDRDALIINNDRGYRNNSYQTSDRSKTFESSTIEPNTIFNTK